MKRTKIRRYLAGALGAAVLLSGCGAAKAGGAVSVEGSTSMERMMQLLQEAFSEEQPGVTVSYSPTGSGAGINAVKEGRADIGLASRDLKAEEQDGLVQTTIAADGIAIIVHPENQVTDLTLDQIRQIYTGEVTNWAELGGAGGQIAAIGREAGSGTRGGFESISDTKDRCRLAQELTATGDVIQTVANNPNAIGYASLADLGDTVRAVAVGGVAPSEETILDGTYQMQRAFNLITKKDAALSPQAQAFFDFAKGAKAAGLMRRAGAVPKTASAEPASAETSSAELPSAESAAAEPARAEGK